MIETAALQASDVPAGGVPARSAEVDAQLRKLVELNDRAAVELLLQAAASVHQSAAEGGYAR